MADPSSVSVVIPAFNEAAAIGDVVAALRSAGSWREILVIDDGSTDGTGARAREAGATVIRHPYNKGNGASVKTGIRQASGEHLLIFDGDGQHEAADAVRIAAHLGDYDLVVGARSAASQASTARSLGNRTLNTIAAYLTGRPIPDLTSGLRGARLEYLREFLHVLPNGFSTPTTTTLAFIRAGHSVRFEPIAARARIGRSKIRLGRDGTRFFLILLKLTILFSPLRIFVPISAASFLIGSSYAVWTVVTQRHVTNSSVLLMLAAVVIFLIGLVSEQIAALRSEGPR